MKEEFTHFIKNIKEGKVRFNERAYIFLFCLLLSTFFWFLSALSQEYTTNLSIPLLYDSMSDEFVLEKDPLKELTIQVSGSGFELLGEQISLNRNKIEVDLEAARLGKNKSFYILSNSLREKIRKELDPDLNLLNITPDSVPLKSQKRIRKKVAVHFNSAITVEKGYGIRREAKIKPDSIWLSGPTSFIDTVKRVETELLKASKLSDTLQKSISLLKPKNIRGIQYEENRVDVLVEIEKYTEKSLLLPIRLDSNSSSFNIRTFPAQVQAYFLVPLSQYQQLNENRLVAQLLLEQDIEKSKKLKVQINNIPEFAKLNRIEPEYVEFIIRK